MVCQTLFRWTICLTAIALSVAASHVYAQATATDIAKAAGLSESEKAHFKGDASRCENFDTAKNCEAKRKLQAKKGASAPVSTTTNSAAAGGYGLTPQAVEKLTIFGDPETRGPAAKTTMQTFTDALTKGVSDEGMTLKQTTSMTGQRTECRYDNGKTSFQKCTTSGLSPFWASSQR
jgi:hypothetical protein